jgi:hypothetical protein
MTDDDLQKLRADYAWKWFDLHAKQRMTLFNYFLIIAGIFANAILLSFRDAGSTAPVVDSTPLHSVVAPATTLPTTSPVSVSVTQIVTGVTNPTSFQSGSSSDAVGTMKTVRRSIGILGAFAAIGFIVFDIRSRALTKRSEDVLEQLERDLIFPDRYKFTAAGGTAQLGILRCERDAKMREGQKRGVVANLTKMKWWIWAIEGLVGLGFLASIFK